MDYTDKRILITGGTSGIGLAAARLFLEKGAVVTVSGSTPASMKKAKNELDSYNERLFGVSADISEAVGCSRLASEAAKAMGGIDVLVNSAGVWLEGPAEKVSEEDWDRVIDINLKGTFFMCRYAIPFLEKTRGCIVNVSSDSGLVGNDEAAVYCASKGGVTLITKSLAVELARKNIRVNAVCPGDVETPMLSRAFRDQKSFEDETAYREDLLTVYPERSGRRFTQPDEVARSILFLASSDVEAITGACLSIDFGLTAGY